MPFPPEAPDCEGLMTEMPPADEPEFVSQQVSDARRYYLDLNPSPDSSLTVVCGGVERMRADYVVSRERFPFCAIELVTEGGGTLELNGKSFSLSPGSLFAYSPNVQHRIDNRSPDRMRKYYVDFAGTEAENLLSQCGLLSGKPLRVSRIHELVDVFEAFDREARGDSAMTGEVCLQWLRLLAVKVQQCQIEEGTGVPQASATYEKVRAHIQQNFLRLNTIESVAAECDISAIHISRLFRRFGGIGAYHYLMRQKMNHAAELLMAERLLVREVADQLGFSDPFQFSRAFKRVYGIPPKQLAQQSRQVH